MPHLRHSHIPPINVTKAEENDGPLVHEFLVELTFSEQDHYDHPTETREEIRQRLKVHTHFTGESVVLIAKDIEETLLGACMCVFFDPGTGLEAEIAEVYVVPGARGKGVARALCEKAVTLFWEKGVMFASVWSRENNPAALSAYLHAGFRPTEQAVLTWLPLENGDAIGGMTDQ